MAYGKPIVQADWGHRPDGLDWMQIATSVLVYWLAQVQRPKFWLDSLMLWRLLLSFPVRCTYRHSFLLLPESPAVFGWFCTGATSQPLEKTPLRQLSPRPSSTMVTTRKTLAELQLRIFVAQAQVFFRYALSKMLLFSRVRSIHELHPTQQSHHYNSHMSSGAV